MRVVKFGKGVWPHVGVGLFYIGSVLSVAAGLACGLLRSAPSAENIPVKDARSLHVVCARPSGRLLRDLEEAARKGTRVTLVTREAGLPTHVSFPVFAAPRTGPDGILVDGIRWIPLSDSTR